MTKEKFTEIKDFCKKHLNPLQKEAEKEYEIPATNKQVWFLASLMVEKNLSIDDLTHYIYYSNNRPKWARCGHLSKNAASHLIDIFLKQV